jgi:hypothetical protein
MLWLIPVDTHAKRIDRWPPPGQPTLYKPEYCELAHIHCLLGATNEVLAGFFGVTRRTIQNWIATVSRAALEIRAERSETSRSAPLALPARIVGCGGSKRPCCP